MRDHQTPKGNTTMYETIKIVNGYSITRMIGTRHRRIDTKEEQTEWLSKEMDKCFPSGFPQFRIDRMKGEYQ